MKIITFIIDALFPPRKDELLVRSLNLGTIKKLYYPHRSNSCVCLSKYSHPIIKTLITENKFYSNKQASRLLSVLLSEFITSQSENLIFIPVPLGKARERERGYNQVLQVLKQVPHKDRYSILSNVCFRTKETRPQVSLPRHERLVNTQNAFMVDVKTLNDLNNRTLVIVDDVCTTGATLESLRLAITKHLNPSCKVICLALAH